MKKLLDEISNRLGSAFEQAGYTSEFAKVSLSNRPDLCEFQCNGALAAAKNYKKAPLMIANEILEYLSKDTYFDNVSAVAPGFINFNLGNTDLHAYLLEMQRADRFGIEQSKSPKKIVLDYGGPNVAKPLHVGHLRSAIIGESIKRILRYAGHEVIGDIHLGDWGLQMGLIITELKERNPDWNYFDEGYQGEYSDMAPFTISELEEIYPTASVKSKSDPEYKEKAMNATYRLQNKERGLVALWKHILSVSVSDLKKNYGLLKVDFDLWKGESDVDDLIPRMVKMMKDENYAYLSEGALVVDVMEETDTKEVPPCMILKSDGATLYNTTDLATIMERMETISPDEIIYVVDKRQELYFEQVFRCAKKTKLVTEKTKLKFLGFGTMNGRDGKPFKTRDGGVMRLESLLQDVSDTMYDKILQNHQDDSEEARKIANTVALAAIKYGDLSNQASKDYIFDRERFTSFEGDTGPYILYTMVRIKSILLKYGEQGKDVRDAVLGVAESASQKAFMLELAKFNVVIDSACQEYAPHKICAFMYDVANACNRFYHETKILSQSDESKKQSYIALIALALRILETCTDLLGFDSPEKM